MLDAGEAFDAVVTFSMPDIDGIAVIQAVRQRCPAIPAALMTGFATEASAAASRARIARPVWLLRKPIHNTQLLDCLRAMPRPGLDPDGDEIFASVGYVRRD